MKNNAIRIILILCLCTAVYAVWDKDKPAASTSLRSSNPEILANWDALETALNREHEYSTGGTVADQAHHKKGSARCFIQDAAPTTRRDTTAFTAEDNGSLWIDTNSSPDNQFNVLTDYSGPTWTPISTEIIAVLLAANRTFAGTLKSTGDFTVGANKVVITAANGNTAVAGTLGVTGVATLGDTSALATSGAPAADAQLANKKYVDDQITASVAGAGFWKIDGSTVFNTTLTSANTFQDLDLSAKVGSNDAIVFLEISSDATGYYAAKPKGYGSGTFTNHVNTSGFDMGGSSFHPEIAGKYCYMTIATNSSGVIQHAAQNNTTTYTIKLIGYIK